MKCDLRKHAFSVTVDFMYPSLQVHVAIPLLDVHHVLCLSQNPVEHTLITEERIKDILDLEQSCTLILISGIIGGI